MQIKTSTLVFDEARKTIRLNWNYPSTWYTAGKLERKYDIVGTEIPCFFIYRNPFYCQQGDVYFETVLFRNWCWYSC
jgi:hypothetical protein